MRGKDRVSYIISNPQCAGIISKLSLDARG